MRTALQLFRRPTPSHFRAFFRPAKFHIDTIAPYKSRSNRELSMTFEDMAKTLVYYHLHEFSSGADLIQRLEQDEFAKQLVAPAGGLKSSTFHDCLNDRGLEQFQALFDGLASTAGASLPREFERLGDLVSVDGSLIDSVLSMEWADYRDGAKKAKAHLGFNVNQGTPCKVFVTNGKADERAFPDQIVAPGQTGIFDRYYQCHRNFDAWMDRGIHFVCRIRANTRLSIERENPVTAGGHVISDVVAILGSQPGQKTLREVRVVTYKVDGKTYLVATDRMDLAAEDVAEIYRLRWTIESFFKWWKRYLGVYHLLSRSRNGLKIQILAGLITYLLLKLHCREKHDGEVTIERVRELRINIQNEAVETLAEENRRTQKAPPSGSQKRKKWVRPNARI